MSINPSIFKAYDIRGVYGEDFSNSFADYLAAALIHQYQPQQVIITRDMRESSQPLQERLVKSFAQAGVDVIDGGLSTTPVTGYAAFTAQSDLAIQVTASHNPKQYNGFKMLRNGSIPVGAVEIQTLKNLIVDQDVALPQANGLGKIEQKDLVTAYLAKVKETIPADLKGLKVAMDTGHGMSVVTFGPLLRELGASTRALYDNLDGSFPAHEANPLKYETLADLQDEMRQKSYDIGFATDGDGDRIGFLDENGEIISSDFITALIAAKILESHPGGTILYDLRSSWAVEEFIREKSGNPRECQVGHSFIKSQMREEGAVFAGELSSHFYFPEVGIFESPELAFLALVGIMQVSGQTLSQLVKPLQKYVQSGEINTEVDDKDAVIARVEEAYQTVALKKSTLDGVKFYFDDWWFNVRPSNTEPVVRLTLEAKTRSVMESKRDEVLALIRQ